LPGQEGDDVEAKGLARGLGESLAHGAAGALEGAGEVRGHEAAGDGGAGVGVCGADVVCALAQDVALVVEKVVEEFEPGVVVGFLVDE